MICLHHTLTGGDAVGAGRFVRQIVNWNTNACLFMRHVMRQAAYTDHIN